MSVDKWSLGFLSGNTNTVSCADEHIAVGPQDVIDTFPFARKKIYIDRFHWPRDESGDYSFENVFGNDTILKNILMEINYNHVDL